MRIKSAGRKTGERRPVLSSAGIRAGATTVVQDPPTLTGAGIGGVPQGDRPTEESKAYYKNPHVINPSLKKSFYNAWPDQFSVEIETKLIINRV